MIAAPIKLNDHAVFLSAQLLSQGCHGAASSAGWWPEGATNNPMCFAQKLMLVVSELSEAMEGDRKNLMDDKLPHRPMREVELADAVIRIFDMAGAFNLDIAGALVEKMAFNVTRADHQPGARQAAGGKAY